MEYILVLRIYSFKLYILNIHHSNFVLNSISNSNSIFRYFYHQNLSLFKFVNLKLEAKLPILSNRTGRPVGRVSESP